MEATPRREWPLLAATAESLQSNHSPAQPEANKDMRFPQQKEPQRLAHTGQGRACLLLEGKGKCRGQKAELAPAGAGMEREGSPSESPLAGLSEGFQNRARPPQREKSHRTESQ